MVQFPMEHPSISRLHAVLQFRGSDGAAFLYDPGSAHGSVVNKQRIPTQTYHPIRCRLDTVTCRRSCRHRHLRLGTVCLSARWAIKQLNKVQAQLVLQQARRGQPHVRQTRRLRRCAGAVQGG